MSATVSHHGPRVPYEIIHLIVREVEMEIQEDGMSRWVTQRERSHILNIALAAKIFLEPALDELWSMMTTLAPLVKPFERHEDEGVPTYGNGFVAKAERFKYYADRIQEYRHTTQSQELTRNMWIWMMNACRTGIIFPNMRHLHVESDWTILGALLSLSHKLALFSVSQYPVKPAITGPFIFLENTLTAFPTSPPGIYLRLRMIPSQQSLIYISRVQGLGRLLLEFPDEVESRYMLCIAPLQSIMDLLQLPLLTHVDLASTFFFFIENGDLSVPDNATSALVSFALRLQITSLIDFITVFQRIKFPHLTALHIFLDFMDPIVQNIPSDDALAHLLTELSRSTNPTAFKSLTLLLPPNVSHRSNLSLTNLLENQSLDLVYAYFEMPTFASLTQSDLSKLASVYPHLRSLKLHPSNPSDFSFAMLVSLVGDLPELVKLWTSIDAHDLSETSSASEDTKSNDSVNANADTIVDDDSRLKASPPLRELILEHSSLSSPLLFAQSVARAFPNLKYWKFSAQLAKEYTAQMQILWDQVGPLLEVFLQERSV